MNEEYDEDCVEKGFQLAWVKLYKNVEEGREALGMSNRSINIWHESKLELAWSNKSTSYFENNFTIFLLYGISNTSIFKVRGVSHWVNLLVMKTFSNIFRSAFCLGQLIFEYISCHLCFLLLPTNFIYVKNLFIAITIKWCFCWYCWWWGFFSVSSWILIHNPYPFTSILWQTMKQNHRDLLNRCSVKNMSQSLAFKWLLNELLFGTEWSEVMLIWWFVSIKFIKSF